jgi:nitrite reductase (NADH) small subunit
VVDGRQIAVFLLADGSVRAMDAVCPHRGGPLADGQVDATVVVCPLHAYAFRLADGACTSDGIGKVHTYPAEVIQDSIAIRVSAVAC